MSFVSESRRPFSIRIGKHQDYMNKNTVVAMHLKDGHDFDWVNVKIVDT